MRSSKTHTRFFRRRRLTTLEQTVAWIFPTGVVLMCVDVSITLASVDGGRSLWALPVLAAVVLLGATAAILRVVLASRSRKLLAEHGGMLCLRCGSSLQGLDRDRVRCPECGETASRSHVRQHWQIVYGDF